MGRRKGGISKESMTKLGTPIGAGPNCATVRPGLVLAGEPSGLRRVGCSIFAFSPLATSLAPWPFLACLPNSPGVLPPEVFLPALPRELVPEPPPPLPPVVVVVPPPVVVVVLPEPPEVVVPPPELPPEPPEVGSVVLGGIEGAAAARVGEVDEAVAVIVVQVRARREDAVGRGVDLNVPDGDRGRSSRSDNRQRCAEGDDYEKLSGHLASRSCPRNLWVCRSRPPRTRRHGGRY